MKKILLSLFVIAVSISIYAQNSEPVLMTVGNETITKSQFLQAYQKNNLLSEATEKDLREYLDLFINYRLKVQEAANLKLDTADAFVKELESYKNQSAQQYLVDTEVSDFLINEAFEHSNYHVCASHILVRCEQNATPKDTAEAYKKILSIYDKITNGLDFHEAAFLYSEDESARDHVNPQTQRNIPGNHGRLGFFSVLEMIYPFECMAYNTPVGTVSKPVRTQFGYHLVYVLDKVPAMAKVSVSQIFLKDSLAMSGKPSKAIQDKLAEIALKYRQGFSFDTLSALYSEDIATKDKGGKMDPFAPSRRPGNYVAAAIKLKPGEISEPVPTTIGWHILKLDTIVYANINDETKYLLKNRISRDSRARKSKESLIAKLKTEYNFQEKGKDAAMKYFDKNLPATYFQSTDLDILTLPGLEKLKPLCTFADKSLTAEEFARYIARFQGAHLTGTVKEFLEQMYPNFVNDQIIRYEHSHLTEKYPEFKALVDEYHDGMMLFEINTQKVWNAAVEDSLGLEKFYESIKTQFPKEQLTEDAESPYKSLDEIRAVVVSRYQDYLESQWIKELRNRYAVKVDEKVFSTILKK